MATDEALDVRTKEWNGGENRETRINFITLTKKILLPVVKKTIIISVPHQEKRELSRDNVFRIYIWSSAAKNRKEKSKPPETIYGIRVDCRDRAYEPCGISGESTVFTDPATGYAVAELFGNDLFIHHDICHHGTDEELKIYERLLKEVVMAMRLTPEKIAGLREKELQAMREKTEGGKAAFSEFCCVPLLGEIRLIEEKAREGKERIAELQKGIADCQQEKMAAREKFEALAAYEKTGVEVSYGEELDKLLTIPGVLGVVIKENTLQIFTNMVKIVENGVTYLIGKFRIEIAMHGREKPLRFYNLTNKGRGPGYTQPSGFDGHSEYNRHHPHVQEEGYPCLGNIKEAIPEYIRAKQFTVVAILALQFLRTVNVEDKAGKGIYFWPKEINP